MLEFSLEVNIADLEKQLRKALFEALKKKYGIDFLAKQINLQRKVQEIIVHHIRNHPTFHSVLSGELLPELGLPFSSIQWWAGEFPDRVAEGVEIISDGIESGNEFILDIHLIWTNQNMRSLYKDGSYVSVGNSDKETFKGSGIHLSFTRIPWLEWLLEGGPHTLIEDFHIIYGEDLPNSRTGLALMRPGGSWSMPPGTGGNADDNFIIEALKQAFPSILKEVGELVGPSAPF